MGFSLMSPACYWETLQAPLAIKYVDLTTGTSAQLARTRQKTPHTSMAFIRTSEKQIYIFELLGLLPFGSFPMLLPLIQ